MNGGKGLLRQVDFCGDGLGYLQCVDLLFIHLTCLGVDWLFDRLLRSVKTLDLVNASSFILPGFESLDAVSCELRTGLSDGFLGRVLGDLEVL